MVFFLLLFVWGVFVSLFPGLHAKAGYGDLGTRLEYLYLVTMYCWGSDIYDRPNTCGFCGSLCEFVREH